jgi:hypothetical protein
MRIPTEFKVGDVVNGMEIRHVIGESWQCVRNGKVVVCSGEKHRKYRRYELRCQKCGYIGRVTYKSLKDGCVGCRNGPCNVQFKDLAGRRFGNLVVLEYIPKADGETYTGVKWKCRCDCGNIFITYSASLLAQNKISCTPCSMKRKAALSTLPDKESTWTRYLSVTRSNAQRKGRSFLLSFEDFKRISKLPCSYCGGLPTIDCKGIVRVGIDRFDNNKGYTLENSRPCCFVCNRMKGRLSHAEFIDHVNKIVSKSGGSARQVTP